MKICTIIGARPQFIKAAAVSRALSHVRGVSEVVVHTGQHYDANMSDIFFAELGLVPPHYHLGIGGGTHGQNTGRMIEAVEAVLQSERPDILLIYGDTDSTLAGAIAAAKLLIPVAHVEAGLRSFNRAMPEEINRILADCVSTYLFIPTETACENLLRENVAAEKIHRVGDVMYDMALYYAGRAKETSTILEETGLAADGYVLATLHRAENTNDTRRLRAIVDGLSRSPLPVVLPLHPRTKKILQEQDITLPDNIRAIDPVGYVDMIWLERNARMIATDSGGVQKEAYFFGVPCLTMRDETEWVELVHAGVNRLVGADAASIAAGLNDGTPRFTPGVLYGDGKAGEKIAAILSMEQSGGEG